VCYLEYPSLLVGFVGSQMRVIKITPEAFHLVDGRWAASRSIMGSVMLLTAASGTLAFLRPWFGRCVRQNFVVPEECRTYSSQSCTR